LNPDLFLLSDGAVTWGQTNLHLVTKALKSGTGGTLFAYKTGMTGTATGVLEHLTRETGGAVFAVTDEQEIAKAATAHRQRPWRLLHASVAGGSDLLIAGRPRSIYPDQRLTVVGRGTPAQNAELVLQLKRGGKRKTVRTALRGTVVSELAPRMYGQVAVGQLEDLSTATENISIAYARHFRVTGRTCSLLMLESEADYRRFDIKPEDDAFVVKSSPAGEVILQTLDRIGSRLEDPKASLLYWLGKMEKMPGVTFQVSTALKLAIEKMPKESFDVAVPPLVCKQRTRAALSKPFRTQLTAEQLDYDTVSAEAARRQQQYGPADALRALSSLVERSPGNMVLTRDVAFSAMQWNLGGQAYPLLQRVAIARPYQPQIYPAMARCLAELGRADLAMVYYEVALAGTWADRYRDFHRIAAIEYLHLLHQIEVGELQCSVPHFAKARREALTRQGKLDVAGSDLVVTMQWNTDRTDVDLHVVEPSGEECYYQHARTESGGRITRDVTQGFGPEMYTLKNASHGKYRIKVKYFGSDANRTTARTKVYVMVYQNFGTPRETVTNKAITLDHAEQMRDVTTVMVEK